MQTLAQIKGMLDKLMRKAKEQDTFNSTMKNRMDSLTTLTHDKGTRFERQAVNRVAPTTLNFSTPSEVQKIYRRRLLDLNADPTPGSRGRDVNKGKSTAFCSASAGGSTQHGGSAPAGKQASTIHLEADESNEPGQKTT